jgi:carboxylesterase type B
MQIYKFQNIRFAAPPVGDLRWAKPAPPPTQSSIVDGSVGNKCPQSAIKGLNVVGTADNSPIAAVLDAFIDDVIEPLFSGGEEDCLFLDVFVPGSAVRSPSMSSLPVIHWFYGGGYVFGSKDMLEDATLPFYDGTGMIKQSGNNVIYVASNYRMGAFGFLAGTTMENEGLPNAGLWDQRAALQWTQNNIHLLGGDSTQVTVMGESAGAGSILHHIVAGGGTIQPLFKRAIMQSIAFQPMWDRGGDLEDVYQQFETFAGCTGQGLACLRNADSSTLLGANTALNNAAMDGAFNVGPAPDGTFIRQLPALELASGNYWKDIDAILVSHVSDEAVLFVDGHVATDAEFTSFMNALFPAVRPRQ